jgi:16S rRNA C967 or C1407 C5-methylase (RsmB/RsmF family)
MDDLNIAILGAEAWNFDDIRLAGTLIEELSHFSRCTFTLQDNVDCDTDAAFLINGDESTLANLAYAYDHFIPVVAFKRSGGLASQVADSYLDERGLTRIRSAHIDTAIRDLANLGLNRRAFAERLATVDLDFDIYRTKPKRFIRINPRDPISISELEKALSEVAQEDVSFEHTGLEGIFVSSTHKIGGKVFGEKNPLFGKHYFIQDAASAFAVYALDLQPGQSMLDMCAAPGMKTILAHDSVGGDVKSVALDRDVDRFYRMRQRFAEHGVAIETLRMDATQYTGPKYDRILVDVPCSREGMTVRYHRKLRTVISGFDSVLQVSEAKVRGGNFLRRDLLNNAYDHLKVGGMLVYATCSVNKIENDSVVSDFLRSNPGAVVDLVDIPTPFFAYERSVIGVRVMPGQTRGLYFTRIRKVNE